jgi:hypothetical protein
MTLNEKTAKKIGKALFASRVTGARALEPTDYGVCCKKYLSAYINFDVGIGMQQEDATLAVRRLDRVLKTVV